MNEAVSYTREELERLGSEEVIELYVEMFQKQPHHKKKLTNIITEMTGEPPAPKEEPGSEDASIGEIKRAFTPAFTAEQTDTKGIVRVKIINPKRTASLRVRDYYDSEGKLRKFQFADGRPRKALIKNNFSLDLSKKDDQLYYEHLKDHPIYVLENPMKCLKIENLYQDAIDGIELEELAMEAKNIVMKLNEEELRDFSRIIGVKAPLNAAGVVIKQRVYDMCNEDPISVIQMWEHPQKDTHLLVRKAIDAGVLKLEGGVYKFNAIGLGVSRDEIILYLMSNPELIPSMKRQLI